MSAVLTPRVVATQAERDAAPTPRVVIGGPFDTTFGGAPAKYYTVKLREGHIAHVVVSDRFPGKVFVRDGDVRASWLYNRFRSTWIRGGLMEGMAEAIVLLERCGG